MTKDVESGRQQGIPWFTMVYDQGVVTDEVVAHDYFGSGTDEDPYTVEWLPEDPRDPQNIADWKKWAVTLVVGVSTLAVSFLSSAYSGSVIQIMQDFNSSEEVVTLGLSLYVLGFAIGPLIWAPMSELYGRQYLFTGTYAMFTLWNGVSVASQNMATLIVFRFLAGAFGSSPLTNAGGVIADMFPASQRGLAMTVFAMAPFLGPVIGPIIGGFVSEGPGWRWNQAVMAIFVCAMWILGTILVPETYAPVLLRRRAQRLSKLSGKVYQSRIDHDQGKITAARAFKTAISRPWILLFMEPIVLLLTIYTAIIYGTLYMLFGAFPICFQQIRGWSQGVGGLAFLGVLVGMVIAVGYAIWDNKRYIRVAQKEPSGFAPPEARLPVVMIGGILIPIGLFWFAWTNYAEVHWIVCIIGTAPFGGGMILVFLGSMNYLIDSYVIFAASVLAANSVLRSLFGAGFPLFTTYMYQNLGIHWASSIPAFLALACVPFPFVFYKYGPAIRTRCKFAAEANEFMKKIREQAAKTPSDEDYVADESGEKRSRRNTSSSLEKQSSIGSGHAVEAYEHHFDDDTAQEDPDRPDTGNRFGLVRPGAGAVRPSGSRSRSQSRSLHHSLSRGSMRSTTSGMYEGNPYDLDRINTRESFKRKAQAQAQTQK